jgi:hypothetical protein
MTKVVDAAFGRVAVPAPAIVVVDAGVIQRDCAVVDTARSRHLHGAIGAAERQGSIAVTELERPGAS